MQENFLTKTQDIEGFIWLYDVSIKEWVQRPEGYSYADLELERKKDE